MALTQEQREELRRVANSARGHILRLAESGGDKWRMTIPPQKDDSDILLYDVCDGVTSLLAEVEAKEGRVGELEAELATKHFVAIWTDGEFQGVSDHDGRREAKAYLDALHDSADFLADRSRLKAFLLPEQVQGMLAAIEPGYWLNSALDIAGLSQYKSDQPPTDRRLEGDGG